MTSINDVRLVGRIVGEPEYVRAANNKEYAKLVVETEKFVRIGGESRRLTAQHDVVCYNQFSIPALKSFARNGVRVKVMGELQYGKGGGRAEVFVPQYSGEVGLMDVDSVPARSEPDAPGTGTAAKPSGGLGRISGGARRAADPPLQPGDRGGSLGYDSEADEIPF